MRPDDDRGAAGRYVVGGDSGEIAVTCATARTTVANGTWMRTATTINVVDELVDTSIWWDRYGAPLKVPALGTHLALELPVDVTSGDLLLALGVDVSLGSHSFIRV
jgi:hypothetical protein